MPGLIRVGANHESNSLEFDIAELVALVGEAGVRWLWNVNLEWAILMDEQESQPHPLIVRKVFDQTKTTKKSVTMSWEEMRALAASIRQTIWGDYIACEKAEYFTRLSALYLNDDGYNYIDRVHENFYTLTEIVFQAVDSSFWLIYVKDDTLLERIATAFQNVETLKRW
jgi:hypothetical protein